MKTTTSSHKAKPAKSATSKAPRRTAATAKKSPAIASQLRDLRESVDALNLHADNLLKTLL
jgi:hypothetical protein